MTPVLLICIAIFLCVGMAVAWAAQRTTGNSGWVDALWSALTGVAAAGGLMVMQAPNDQRRWVAFGLIVIWAIRLASHIARRSRGAGEDPRYADLIRQWGSRASSQLFIFLQIQALAAFGLVVSSIAATANPAPGLTLTDGIALIIALVAITGEGVADAQLRAHSRENGGRKTVNQRGLWAYSRHPNYFFEWLFWCAWPVMAIGGGWGLWALSLIAPALMYWLLVYASGIPPLEKHMLKSRGDAYRRYQAEVSPFFPLPRRHRRSS